MKVLATAIAVTLVTVNCSNYGLYDKMANPASITNSGQALLAFVSSMTTQPSFPAATSTFATGFPACNSLTGLPQADCACMQMATQANLPVTQSGYVAWLSISTADMTCRIQGVVNTHCTLPMGSGPAWVNTMGQTVAIGYGDLFGGILKNAIQFSQMKGPPADPVVWTGTSADGTNAASGTCGDWTSGTGMYGDSLSTSATWTNNGSTACGGTPHSIYCFARP